MFSPRLVAILAFLAVLGSGPAALALDGDEILRQIDRKLSPESYEMYRKLINIEPDGKKKEFVLYTVRLKMRVDSQALVPTEIEAYAASGLLIKTLHFKDIKNFGDGVRRPATLETDSPLYKGYKSVMLYANIKTRTFPDEVFTLDYLPRAGELR